MRQNMLSLQPYLSQQYAVEPIIIVKITGPSGTSYHSTKSFEYDSNAVIGNLDRVPSFEYTKRADGLGEVGFAAISLVDTARAIQLDSDSVAEIMQYVAGAPEAVVILSGKIKGPITWSEGERVATFSVTPNIKEDAQIGYVPLGDETFLSDGTLECLADSILETPWPVCYGTVLNVPAVRLTQQRKSTLKSDFQSSIFGYKNSGTDPDDESDDFFEYSSSFIRLEHPEIYPHGEVVTLAIGPATVTGQFRHPIDYPTVADREIFDIVDDNAVRYTSISVASRISGDKDMYQSNVLWLPDDSYNLEGLSCQLLNNGNYTNRCIKQIGRKCWFAMGWVNAYTGVAILMQSGHTIANAGLFAKSSGFPDDAGETKWSDNRSGTPTPGGNYVQYSGDTNPTWEEYLESEIFKAQTGTEVRHLQDGSDYQPETYVFNLIGHTDADTILSVKAVRDYKNETKPIDVPSRYYAIDTLTYETGKTASILTLPRPLASYGEGWDDNIYVSLTSISDNVCDVIEDLATRFGTDLTIDTATFDPVSTIMDNYPVGFAIQDMPNLFDTLSDIAWQARCFLSVEANKVYIKYLSAQPPIAAALQPDNIENKTIEYSVPEYTDLTTQVTATWQRDYADASESKTAYRSSPLSHPSKLRYSNNVDKYGLNESEWKFWIYNIEACVNKSLQFWGQRKSTPWEIISLSTYIDMLILQLQDCVSLQTVFDDGTVTNALCTVQSLNYSVDDYLVAVTLETSGTGYWVTETDCRTDLSQGLSRYDYIPPIDEDVSVSSVSNSNVQDTDKDEWIFGRVTVIGAPDASDNKTYTVVQLSNPGREPNTSNSYTDCIAVDNANEIPIDTDAMIFVPRPSKLLEGARPIILISGIGGSSTGTGGENWLFVWNEGE